MKRITGLLAVLALGGAAALADPPAARRPVFKADVEAVNLAVSISDGQQFVGGLGPGDFRIYEDGVEQQLALFAQEPTPVSLAILIDCSLSMDRKIGEARAAASRFAGQLRPQDEAQVVQFNERVVVAQGFTSDHARLQEAIQSSHTSGGTALYTAVYVALKDLARQRREREMRRLAVVVLSDGDDTSSLVSDDQVLELARRSEIAVYGISLRAPLPPTAVRDETGLSRYFIAALSRETGGEAHFPGAVGQLDSLYARVLGELRAQYSMGYVSSNARRDGRWRNIEVRVPQRAGVRVRHKPGYFAPSR